MSILHRYLLSAKTAVACIIFLCSGFLYAQQWERVLGGPDGENIYKVTTTHTLSGESIALSIGETSSFGETFTNNPPNVYVSYANPEGTFALGLAFNIQGWGIDYSIVSMGSGEFAWTSGFWNNATGSYDLAVVRGDRFGQILWTTVLGGFETDGGTSIIRLSDGSGDLIVAGFTESTAARCRDGLIARLDDTDGSVLWARTYGRSGNDELYCIRASTTGNLYAVGSTTSANSSAGDLDVWLLSVQASDGDVIYSRCYGGLANDRAYSLVLTQDPVFGSEISIVGESYSFGTFLRPDIYVIRAQRSTGVSRWQAVLDIMGGKDVGYAVDNRINNGNNTGDIVIVGQTNNPTYPRGNGFAMEISNDGNAVAWAEAYGGGHHENLRSITKFYTPEGSNNYWAGGTSYSFGAGTADQYLLRMSAMGMTGMELDPFNQQECAQRIIPSLINQNNYYTCNVTTANVITQNSFIFQVDFAVELTVVCDEDPFIPLINPGGPGNLFEHAEKHNGSRLLDVRNAIVPAPNPVLRGDIIQLIVDEESEGAGMLKAVDVYGRQVFAKDIRLKGGKQEIPVDTFDWPFGTYTIMLHAGSKVKAVKIVVLD